MSPQPQREGAGVGSSPPLGGGGGVGIPGEVGPWNFSWRRACALVWGVSFSPAGVTLPLTSLGPSAPWDSCRGDTARLCREVKPRTRPRRWTGAPPWVHLTTEGGWISTVPHRTGTGAFSQSLLEMPTPPTSTSPTKGQDRLLRK